MLLQFHRLDMMGYLDLALLYRHQCLHEDLYENLSHPYPGQIVPGQVLHLHDSTYDASGSLKTHNRIAVTINRN